MPLLHGFAELKIKINISKNHNNTVILCCSDKSCKLVSEVSVTSGLSEPPGKYHISTFTNQLKVRLSIKQTAWEDKAARGLELQHPKVKHCRGLSALPCGRWGNGKARSRQLRRVRRGA